MERTESLMGKGRMYPDGKFGQHGVEIKYQIQANSDENSQTDWEGFVRLPVGMLLPGTKSANPNPKVRYILVLEDNENRQGHILIEKFFGEAGGFYNYAIRGQERRR